MGTKFHSCSEVPGIESDPVTKSEKQWKWSTLDMNKMIFWCSNFGWQVPKWKDGCSGCKGRAWFAEEGSLVHIQYPGSAGTGWMHYIHDAIVLVKWISVYKMKVVDVWLPEYLHAPWPPMSNLASRARARPPRNGFHFCLPRARLRRAICTCWAKLRAMYMQLNWLTLHLASETRPYVWNRMRPKCHLFMWK